MVVFCKVTLSHGLDCSFQDPGQKGIHQESMQDEFLMKKILLIEGNKNIRRFIKRELSKSGHMVMETADGYEALQMLKNNEPQILIVDIHTKKKKALENFRVDATSSSHLPVIILTSKTPYKTDVSNWNPAFVLERSSKTPELLSAIEKLPASKPARKKEPQEKNYPTANQSSSSQK